MTIGSVGSTWALPFILLLVAVLAMCCVFFVYLCRWWQRADAPDRRAPDHLPDTGQAQHLPPRDGEVEGRGAAIRREDAEAGVPAPHAAAACDGAQEVLVAADALLAERPAEALPLFERATRLAPDCAAAWSGVASAQIALLQPDEALAAATRALQLAPDDAAAWCSQSWALGCLRRYKPALVAAQRALALAPDDPSSWETQANALYCLRRYQEAVTSFEHALALGSGARDRLGWTGGRAGALTALCSGAGRLRTGDHAGSDRYAGLGQSGGHADAVAALCRGSARL